MKRRSYKSVTVVTLLLSTASMSAQQKLSTDWMLAYVQKPDQAWQRKDVRSDPQYKIFLRAGLSGRLSVWGPANPLVPMVQTYLGVGTGNVEDRADRYLSISGCVPHNCTEADGLLWVDSKATRPAIYFAATEHLADFKNLKLHLWIFAPANASKPFRLTPKEDRARGLPQPFVDGLKTWFNETADRELMSLTIVNANGELIPIPACELQITAYCAK